MARLILELTNRCNLRCRHCFDERHAATGEIPGPVVQGIIRDGHACGIDHLCFSGGEPTLYRGFATLVRQVAGAGYTFSFVSNGWRFPHVARSLQESRDRFAGVTFSLDAAREKVHDALRGRGSYREVMRAASVCVVTRLPFTLNMVLTAQNADQVDEMVDLATRLGSRGVRFGHLMFTEDVASRGLQLSPGDRRAAEERVWSAREHASIHVSMGPGFYSASPWFPCGPLSLREFNVDYRGNLTLCCQLSGHGGPNDADDVVANLSDVSLADACARFRDRVAAYLTEKRRRVTAGAFDELDHFPCWYCTKFLHKAAADPAAGWLAPSPLSPGRRLHVLTAACASGS